MSWEIDKIWGDIRRLLERVISVEHDVGESTVEIEALKRQMRSERAKRGWATRRAARMQADLSDLMTRVAALEAAGSRDENAAREIFDEVEEHINRLH